MSDARISLDEVRQVAQLARLTLSDEEAVRMQHDLARILEYVSKLGELDTSGVEPTFHAVELSSVLREDRVQPSLGVERALAAAPERLGDGFGVPKVIE